MKILNKIKYTLIYMFVISFLMTDKHLSFIQREIFEIYMILFEPNNNDWRYRKLVSFSLYKGLPILILAAFSGNKPYTTSDMDFNKLKTIIGMEDFKKWYFNNLNEEWLHQKWYNNTKLPLVCKIKNNLVVIDGNHRMAQQIYHNEIKYNYVYVNGGWLKLFFKIIFGKI